MGTPICCYGWSGESAKIISENLKTAGFELVDDGIQAMWNPDNENIKNALHMGDSWLSKFILNHLIFADSRIVGFDWL